MVKTTRTVIISLPKELVEKIEEIKKDLPLSLVYRRLLTKAIGDHYE